MVKQYIIKKTEEYKTDNIDPVRFIRSVIRALGVERSQEFHGK